MPLRPFQLPSGDATSAIMIDASTVGETTVTVAVSATREWEPAMLDAIYRRAENHGLSFKPFYHKANDFTYEERRAFSEAVIEDQQAHIAAFAHDQERDGNANTQQIEAVHSAILVDDLLTDIADTLVLIDGNEQQATPFVRGLRGLRSELPVVGNCLQSEYYYPPALLADLVSNHLAHSIDRGDVDPLDPLLPAPHAKQTRDEWGEVFNAMYQDSADYIPPSLQNRRGETVQERIYCWYDGAVAMDGGADRPMSDSLTSVVNALEQEGYDELARILEEL